MAGITRNYFYGAAAAVAIAGILHLSIVPNIIGFSPITGLFFLVAGMSQLFWTIPSVRRWGRNWHYIGLAGTVVLIILFLVTRIPTPITGGRALPVIGVGIATIVVEIIYVGIIGYVLAGHRWISTKQKEQLK
jgi:hypothetical protein